ncbi:hypothetical protein WMY93_004058 [Mugilogobius chulae]|uniref:Protein kinase domain-containing protein n=1 Tax=Mugilogobius chulae TaxID=88201 RepID=A0AAW0PNI3_9GOBI
MSSLVNLPDIYRRLENSGEGAFGTVIKCMNTQTGKTVAIKIIKERENIEKVIRRELSMIEAIRSLDPDKDNVIRFHRFHDRQNRPFSLGEIRAMANDLLIALDGLKRLGVMHTDIKPDNIMFVEHKQRPFKVKLIDFGVARLRCDVRTGTSMQPPAYRAPEVMLGLPLTEAVDMWSLGCCLLEWYLNYYPFRPKSYYDHIRQIVHLLGVPDGDVINQAMHGTDYFVQKGSQWKLKDPYEYGRAEGALPLIRETKLKEATDLEDLVKNYYEIKFGLEFEDRKAFLDLLARMFHWNPENRITPAQALSHPFVTASHFSSCLSYTEHSYHLLTYKPTLGSDANGHIYRNKKPQKRFCSQFSNVQRSESSFSHSGENTETGNDSAVTSESQTPSHCYRIRRATASSDSENSEENSSPLSKDRPSQTYDGSRTNESVEKEFESASCSQSLLTRQTGEIVAVKTMKRRKDLQNAVGRELSMLKALKPLDPEENNIVAFNEYFQPVKGVHCFEFEGLDVSVKSFMKQLNRPIYLEEIRTMAKDLLIALDGLKRLGVMHTDIKPDNIMFVDQEKQPFRVKLIDFGVAKFKSNIRIGQNMQPPAFRAPEVTLGFL